MAPLTTEPDHLRVVLNPGQREALYDLVTDITVYMRSQLELTQGDPIPRVPTSQPGTGQKVTSPPPPPPPQEPSKETSSTPMAPVSVSETESTPENPSQEKKQPEATTSDPSDQPSQGLPQPRRVDKKLQKPQPPKHVPPTKELINLRVAAIKHFDGWRNDTRKQLKEVLAKKDEPDKIAEARQKRQEALDARSRDAMASEGQDPKSTDPWGSKVQVENGQAGSVSNLQELYYPVPTILTTIPPEDRKEMLSAVMLLFLSTGHYSAHSRTLQLYLASALEISQVFLDKEETEIAMTMIEAVEKAEQEKNKKGMSADAETEKRRKQGQLSRYLKVGLASVAGAAIIGVTGGLAAPVIAGALGGVLGGVGLGGLAGFLGIFWMNAALVGTLFGAFGANMTGKMIDKYAKEVQDFKFIPLKEEPSGGDDGHKANADNRRLRVTIGINGWLNEEEDVTKPWRGLGDDSEVFALRFEMKSLLELGKILSTLVKSAAWGAIKSEILRSSVFAVMMAAMWPITLVSMASNLDNPFSVARNRSEKAGEILADALINKVQGERPVTLVGYSLGARVIYTCLRSLAKRKAFGIVDTVVLIGSPVPSNPAHWQFMRSVVAGNMYNVYSENDMILAFLYRTTSAQIGVAGLQDISKEVKGVHNLNLSKEVLGHLRYPDLLGQILTRCGFPSIAGGEEAIEQEEDIESIKLDDKEFDQDAQLVDLDDSTTTRSPSLPAPPKYTPIASPTGATGVPNLVDRKESNSVSIEDSTSNVEATSKPEATTTTDKAGGDVLFDAEGDYTPSKAIKEEDIEEEDDDDDSVGEVMMQHVEPLSIDDDEKKP